MNIHKVVSRSTHYYGEKEPFIVKTRATALNMKFSPSVFQKIGNVP